MIYIYIMALCIIICTIYSQTEIVQVFVRTPELYCHHKIAHLLFFPFQFNYLKYNETCCLNYANYPY